MPIRSITQNDIDDIISIAKANNLSYWSENDYRLELARSDSYLKTFLSDTGETLGFLVGRLIPSAENGSANDAEIYNIGVLPSVKRQGIGKFLLNDFIDFCRFNKAKVIWLDVRISNASAIEFYRSFGFEKQHERRAFYKNPLEDAAIYNLKLT